MQNYLICCKNYIWPRRSVCFIIYLLTAIKNLTSNVFERIKKYSTMTTLPSVTFPTNHLNPNKILIYQMLHELLIMDCLKVQGMWVLTTLFLFVFCYVCIFYSQKKVGFYLVFQVSFSYDRSLHCKVVKSKACIFLISVANGGVIAANNCAGT